MLRRLAAVLVGLVLVAVATPAAAAPGVDYSWYRPTRAELAGVQVVARYLVPASWGSGKALTAAEAAWLLAQGKTILLNWEWSPVAARGGYAAGVRDARLAELARAEVGAPPVVIYLSADWDVQPAEVPAVLAYLAGAASVIGRDRVGVYGGYRAVAAALGAGYRWGWQTAAWSRGRWDPRAHYRQTANSALWGGQGDRDASTGDVGGWWTGSAEVIRDDELRPRHVGPPPPASARFYRVRGGDTLSGIAARFGTSWPALASLNRLAHPDRIYPGQLLRVR